MYDRLVGFSAKDIDIHCAIRVQGLNEILQFFVVHDCTVHWQKEKRDKEDVRDGSFFQSTRGQTRHRK